MKKIIIDTNQIPSLPFPEACILYHQRNDKLILDLDNLNSLYITHGYRGRIHIIDQEIKELEERKALPKLPQFLNACICDYLFINQHLIPKKFRIVNCQETGYFLFWGTMFGKIGSNSLFVRSLGWSEKSDKWIKHYYNASVRFAP